MLIDGVRLMFLGIGIVFAFLWLLYSCVVVFGRIMATKPSNIPRQITSANCQNPVAGEGEVVAVIAAAVKEYRRRR